MCWSGPKAIQWRFGRHGVQWPQGLCGRVAQGFPWTATNEASHPREGGGRGHGRDGRPAHSEREKVWTTYLFIFCNFEHLFCVVSDLFILYFLEACFRVGGRGQRGQIYLIFSTMMMMTLTDLLNTTLTQAKRRSQL